MSEMLKRYIALAAKYGQDGALSELAKQTGLDRDTVKRVVERARRAEA